MAIIDLIPIILCFVLLGCLVYSYRKNTKLSMDNESLELESSNMSKKCEMIEKSLNELKTSTLKEMDDWKNEIEKKSNEELRVEIERIESDYNVALKEEMENLNKEIEDIDTKLGEKVQDILRKNTLTFYCACDKTRKIPCTIDFSRDENRFTCDKCGSEYRVEISAYPVLISNVSSNKILANLYDK